MSLWRIDDGTVDLRRVLRAERHASAPSFWSMLGYKDTTSIVTSVLPSLTERFLILNLLIKSVESRMYDGVFTTIGFKNVSTNSDRRVVGESDPLQIPRSAGKREYSL